eukprot:TCONS_00067772-protein
MCSIGYSCCAILLLLAIFGHLIVVDCAPINSGDDPCKSRRWWGCKLKQTNNGLDKDKQKEQFNNLLRGVLGELVSGMKNGRKRGYDDQELTQLFENIENKQQIEKMEKDIHQNEVEETHRLYGYLKILYGLVDDKIKELDRNTLGQNQQQQNT